MMQRGAMGVSKQDVPIVDPSRMTRWWLADVHTHGLTWRGES